MDGRNAEITIDLVPEDAVVSEMIKQLPLEWILILLRCFQERFGCQMEAPCSWKIVKLIFLRKPIYLVLFFAWSRKGNQKIGRNCMWEA